MLGKANAELMEYVLRFVINLHICFSLNTKKDTKFAVYDEIISMLKKLIEKVKMRPVEFIVCCKCVREANNWDQ